MGGRGCAGRRGIKGGKWDNCNSIINKIHLKIINKQISPKKKKKKENENEINVISEKEKK